MTDISFNSYTGTFQDVKNIWNEKLWPNRKSTIKEMSSMQYLDGFDMAIYEKYKPTFFIVKHKDTIVGVNSGHRTKDRLYRSRGIWVDPEFRRYGVAQILFDMTEKQAKKEKWLYYTGKADPEIYIDKPFDHKVIRQDMDMYLGSDDDLIKIQSKMDYYQVMLNYLDSILKSITNRTYQIKNAIEWQKFIRGYSD